MASETPRWYMAPSCVSGKFDVFHHDDEIFKRWPDLVGKIKDARVLTAVSEEKAKEHIAFAVKSEAERDAKKALVDGIFDETNWKLPTKRWHCMDEMAANALASALTYFCGGAEIEPVENGYNVGSLGYYHYVGA